MASGDWSLVVAAGLAGLVAGWGLAWSRANARRAVAEAEAAARVADVEKARALLEAALAREQSHATDRQADLHARLAAAQQAGEAAAQQIVRVERERAEAREQLARLESALTQEQQAHAVRLADLQQAESRLADTFARLSAQALEHGASGFLQLATTRFETLRTEAGHDLETRQAAISAVVAPMHETLDRLSKSVAELDRLRTEDKGRLTQQLVSVGEGQAALQAETARLVRALQVPNVRGRWGELQLQRVVELAGMTEHCDFETQATVDGDEGYLRPDLVVTLPGQRTVVVDAKAPITAYLDAMGIADEAGREARLRDHAAQVRSHVGKLGAKAYWSKFDSTPDFVVLFLPGESFFSAAVQYDPSLFEYGVQQRVFLAGPFTLLALLRTVAHGWNSERLAENANAISLLGKELYERLAVVGDHLAELRNRLQGAVEAHNKVVASLETRVLPSARRFRELGVVPSKELATLTPVEQTPRRLQAPEFVGEHPPSLVDAVIVAGPALEAEDD